MSDEHPDCAAPERPVLRYPGGKALLAPWILEHCPPHQCYVEPFMGAASVYMRKPRASVEVLNDLNQEIVSFFAILRDPLRAAELERVVRLTPYARKEYDEAYFPATDSIEQARRLLIRSWQGFNSEGTLGHKTGWRYCSVRRRTGPSHDWASFPEQIQRFTQRLQGVLLEHRDALELFPCYDGPHTLWYVDPPYDATVCPGFDGYGYAIDHTALSLALHHLAGMVVLSGYHSPTYDTLYADWACVERRAYAGHNDVAKRPRTEVLWLNPACQRGLAQLSFFGAGLEVGSVKSPIAEARGL